MRMLRICYLWLPSGTGIWGIISFSLIRLLLAVIIIAVVISLTKLARHGTNMVCVHNDIKTSSDFNSSMNTINDRLAKGEITIDEHYRLKTELFR